MINQSKKDEGLPDVAQPSQRKKPIILVIVGVILALSLSTYYYTKPAKKADKPIEEIYSVASEAVLESKKETPAVQASTDIAAAKAPPISPEVMQQQIALLQQKQKELQQRLSAPLMVVNNNQANGQTDASKPTQAVSQDANTQFLNQVSSQNNDAVTATTIGPLNTIVAEGSLIHATLESASNSDLPGNLRASVSEPVYSEDGSQVLIPQGSRLNGQYKSGMMQGQSRIFVVWTRLITPNGVSIQLGSAGVDSLGMAGMGADEINRHFWERFGTASLLSIIGAGASNVGVNSQDQNNSASAYRAAVASSFAQSAGESLQQESKIAPTLQAYQGKPIMVFVAHDLHFQSVMKQIKTKMNMF